ncbi:hypothetical protein K491DRAFT_215572 [Lophiostoma macrostomum CBS 122681]|uniref:Zinc finger PHD-type domain-containing protein n=1 Tax=Lophiostoma macrostomum CBS 122681 TaxID=1314788 RepID=A0A6A6TGI0_9PLEO|nr:hypothetical protein K491DRAFT_215572 [Lophiostoma macrostomum CBS 122681]
MTKDVLFRWEDSPSLKHHCGFCERPLSHPGAKSSCIGIHAEPCHRFHQALFMRNRGHCCAACIGADEAHHKRHTRMAEILREMYELRGEDPFIGGDNDAFVNAQAWRPGDRNGCHSPDENLGSSPDGSNADVSLLKKKERKDFKKLEKAKNRPKVVTLEEIEYLDSVLHPKEDIKSTNGGSEPANLEEVDEIERNLRYNAKEYNTGVKRTLLQSSTSVRNAEVDFEVEMARILCTLRVRDGFRTTGGNHSLKGKSLATFNKLGKSLEEKITEDLILVKKDELETRMRRASFLRYINRSSFDIIQNRYSILDWKTGERIISSPEEDKLSEPSLPEDEDDSVKENMPLPEERTADVRHISIDHRRLDSDGHTGGESLVATSSTPKTPARVASLPPTLRITPSSNSKGPVRTVSNSMGLPPRTPPTVDRTLKVMQNPSAPYQFQAPPRRSLQPLQDKHPNTPASFQGQYPAMGMHAFPSLQTTKRERAISPPAVDVPIPNPWKPKKAVVKLQEGHAPVSQKKPKKNRDKTRKAAQYAKATELTLAPIGEAVQQEPYKDQVTAEQPEAFRAGAADGKELPGPIQANEEPATASTYPPHTITLLPNPPPPASPQSPSPRPPLPISTDRKTDDWKLYTRHFILEGLTDPFTDPAYCAHRCAHRGSTITDCPFHHPCPSYNPMSDRVFLVYPSPDRILHTGPFNRLRAEKLLNMFNASADDIVKGRLMLVDDDIYDWITRKPSVGAGVDADVDREWGMHRDRDRDGDRDVQLPARIKREMMDFTMGLKEGSGLKQESRYNTMSITNGSRAVSKQPSEQHLASMTATFEPLGSRFVCYCADVWKQGEVYVECRHGQCKWKLFHRKCVRATWIEGVRNWYCWECEGRMERQADRLVAWLNGEVEMDDVGQTDDTVADDSVHPHDAVDAVADDATDYEQDEAKNEDQDPTSELETEEEKKEEYFPRKLEALRESRTMAVEQALKKHINERVGALRGQGRTDPEIRATMRVMVEQWARKEGLNLGGLLTVVGGE